MADGLIKKMPGYQRVYSRLQAHFESSPSNPYLRAAAPGHFYSPIPDADYIRKHRADLFARSRLTVPGVEINSEKQIGLIEELASYYCQFPFTDEKQDKARYHFHNGYFEAGEAVVLYSIMRHFHPRRIVEVGSGFTSAAMLDINDLFLDGRILFTFIDPYPERLHTLLSVKDRQSSKIIVDLVQNSPDAVFADLDKNDILFLDSSHVAKIGSDVVYLLTEILPTLKAGVLVHIHDIYWPFEYPEDWVLSGRAWNEAYLVKAFLQFNSSFEILVFNSYLSIHYKELVQQYLPILSAHAGSSLWIRKTA